MKELKYTIQDKQGIHARPGGALVKLASGFNSKITISKGDKSGDLKRIFAVMGLCAKQGDEITITADGDDENTAIAEIENFLNENL